MITRVNLTGLKKLNVSEASLEIYETPDGKWTWIFHNNIDPTKFTEGSRVNLDFKSGPYFHREALGTVNELPKNTSGSLPDVFGVLEVPKFRVRVALEDGAISRSYLKWRTPELKDAPSTSFFKIRYTTGLNQVGWRLDGQESDEPTLLLNQELKHLRSEHWFRLMVIPAALREVYRRIFTWSNLQDADIDSQEWMRTWIQFAINHLSLTDPSELDKPDGESQLSHDQVQWINEAESAFCLKNNLLEKLLEESGEVRNDD